ncbi:unnamed protein product [Mycena citricolor]|uniref:Calcium uniporter protein, mitochondrial n=1 Tax=Mycena citricolor TaxID=2018698 RepID=A0AAD2HNX1_9AGAR|nr:unnamed protein product [Mycena citricolor]
MDGARADDLPEGKGKLASTSSHLFKLILPLGMLDFGKEGTIRLENHQKHPPPTVLLLHPSQPLSHVSRLILASLDPTTLPKISFQSKTRNGRDFQWSDSTDIGDFIRDAAQAAHFTIHFTSDGKHDSGIALEVEVPTAADRTRFMRRRLQALNTRMKSMEKLKLECDREAHRSAKRMATGGFGVLAMYWALVARLTFWDYGWDVMEPITYLSGLSTVMGGYLWFLYQGREVSYSSVLDRSISSRRHALYKARGFDIERWMELVTEAKALRREVQRITDEYDDTRSRADDEQEDEDTEKEEEKEKGKEKGGILSE